MCGRYILKRGIFKLAEKENVLEVSQLCEQYMKSWILTSLVILIPFAFNILITIENLRRSITNPPSYDLSVVLVGNSGVGKTNFLNRYAWNQFSHSTYPTLGVDCACKDLLYEDKRVRLQIWDTAGQEQCRALGSL